LGCEKFDKTVRKAEKAEKRKRTPTVNSAGSGKKLNKKKIFNSKC
jgi:hypothetical protein